MTIAPAGTTSKENRYGTESIEQSRLHGTDSLLHLRAVFGWSLFLPGVVANTHGRMFYTSRSRHIALSRSLQGFGRVVCQGPFCLVAHHLVPLSGYGLRAAGTLLIVVGSTRFAAFLLRAKPAVEGCETVSINSLITAGRPERARFFICLCRTFLYLCSRRQDADRHGQSGKFRFLFPLHSPFCIY